MRRIREQLPPIFLQNQSQTKSHKGCRALQRNSQTEHRIAG